MELFEVHPYSLQLLLRSIHEGQLQLPDFQRDFVWDARVTEELLESISRSFPAGSLLFMPYRSGVFKPRRVQNAPEDGGGPERLILDGQQRLTSLYQAMYGVGDSRYFVNLALLMDDGDIDDALFYRHHKRSGRYASRAQQADQLVLPLGVLFGQHGGFESWLDDVIELRPETGEERAELKRRIRSTYEQHVKPLETYRFPVVVLDAGTELEAVCSIFETLNRTGVRLGVFELLTARFYADDLSLRDLWNRTRDERPTIDEFGVDPYYLLQSVALRKGGSCKRSDVLKLSRDDVDLHWPAVSRGCDEAIQMVRDECGVLTPKWLSYQYLLVPLSACWQEAIAVPGPAAGANRAKLKRWFWCSALSSTYEFAANSQAARDFNELRSWLSGGVAPQPVESFVFEPERLREITPRQQAVYKACIALTLRAGSRDFHKGRPLTPTAIATDGVDDHHLFPQAYLRDRGVTGSTADCVLNRTMIDAATNRRIGKRAPSDYLSEIRDALGQVEGASDFSELLGSHLLPVGDDSPLLADDFDRFLAWRESRLVEAIREATA